MATTSVRRPASPSLQNASVSTRTFIDRQRSRGAEQQQGSVGLACVGNVDVLRKELPQLTTGSDVAVECLHGHRGSRVVSGLSGPSEDDSASADTVLSLDAARLACEVLEVSRDRRIEVRHRCTADEDVGGVCVSTTFDIGIVIDLVFFINDGVGWAKGESAAPETGPSRPTNEPKASDVGWEAGIRTRSKACF